MVAYIKTSYEPEMYLEHRVEIYNQLQAGTFPVSVYYKNTLLRTCQVTVTGADSKVVKYRKWMNELEQKAWTSGMTVMEKLTAIKKYIYDNYTYTTDGVMCNAGAQALLYAARDLGLTARYRFVGPQYDYEKGYGDVYYHFGSAFCGGHVCTIITMDGKDYITYLYLDQNSLKELFTAVDTEISPDAGTLIAELSDFQAEALDNGFYHISLQSIDDRKSDFYLHSYTTGKEDTSS